MTTPPPPPLPLDAVPPELEFSTWVGQLVKAHRSGLMRAAMREGLLAEEALDAVQEAFATFIQRREWRSLPRDTADAPKLLTTLVQNHARNQRRKHSRKDEGMDALTGNAEVDTAWRQLDELMIEAEEHLKLTGCIATLKEVQRTIVTARFFEGASGLEVADEMGITPGNVAVILHRAREQLRGCLEASREHFGMSGPTKRST
ncbi:MAG: sigma-70 family RNA polymerase sigma factor [Myxococcaceae bacterium]|jgi:RNA polymerase sigma-70 factor (ECF subfamily)|nr:sigma-70 family RNA polymerase sigma factor [Myxococcaceae bacterium]